MRTSHFTIFALAASLLAVVQGIELRSADGLGATSAFQDQYPIDGLAQIGIQEDCYQLEEEYDRKKKRSLQSSFFHQDPRKEDLSSEQLIKDKYAVKDCFDKEEWMKIKGTDGDFKFFYHKTKEEQDALIAEKRNRPKEIEKEKKREWLQNAEWNGPNWAKDDKWFTKKSEKKQKELLEEAGKRHAAYKEKHDREMKIHKENEVKRKAMLEEEKAKKKAMEEEEKVKQKEIKDKEEAEKKVIEAKQKEIKDKEEAEKKVIEDKEEAEIKRIGREFPGTVSQVEFQRLLSRLNKMGV